MPRGADRGAAALREDAPDVAARRVVASAGSATEAPDGVDWAACGRRRPIPGGDQDMPMERWCGLLLVSLLLGPAAAGAEILLPPGSSAEVYVRGGGFAPDTGRASRGIPATS